MTVSLLLLLLVLFPLSFHPSHMLSPGFHFYLVRNKGVVLFSPFPFLPPHFFYSAGSTCLSFNFFVVSILFFEFHHKRLKLDDIESGFVVNKTDHKHILIITLNKYAVVFACWGSTSYSPPSGAKTLIFKNMIHFLYKSDNRNTFRKTAAFVLNLFCVNVLLLLFM